MSHYGPLKVFLPHQAKKCISLHCTVMLFLHFLSGLFKEKIIIGRKNMRHMKFPLKWFSQMPFPYHGLASSKQMYVNSDQVPNQCNISIMYQDSQQLIKVIPQDMGLGKPHYRNLLGQPYYYKPYYQNRGMQLITWGYDWQLYLAMHRICITSQLEFVDGVNQIDSLIQNLFTSIKQAEIT